VRETADVQVRSRESEQDSEIDPDQPKGVQGEHVPAGEHAFDRLRVVHRSPVRRRARRRRHRVCLVRAMGFGL